MLEIQIFNETTELYETLDLFGDVGVDMVSPAFPTSNIGEAMLSYSEAFNIPSTDRNIGILTVGQREFNGRLVNGSVSVEMVIVVQDYMTYTPKEHINIQAISKIKKFMESLKKDTLTDLFEQNDTPYIVKDYNNNDVIVNDGEYGFTLKENDTASYSDDLMTLTYSNFVDDQYDSSDCPLYMMDSANGARSFHPTFKVSKFLDFLFKHYGFDLEISGKILGSFQNNFLGVRIPTEFKSDTSDRNVDITLLDYEDGAISLITHHQEQPLSVNKSFNFDSAQTVNGQLQLAYLSQHKTSYHISVVRAMNGVDIVVNYKAWYDWYPSGGALENVQVDKDIPLSINGIQIVSGDLYKCVRVLNHETEIGIILYKDINGGGCFYNNNTFYYTDNIVEYISKYGDSITFEIGYYAENLLITCPTHFKAETEVFSGSQDVEVISGYYSQGHDFILKKEAYIIITADPANILSDQGEVSVSFTLPSITFIGNSSPVQFTVKNDYDTSRYGDKVNIKESYKDSNITLYEILNDILRRYNLNISYSDKFYISNESNFYDKDTIICDTIVSEGISVINKYLRYSSLNFLNKDYGNVNDIIDEKNIYDLLDHDTGYDSGEVFKMSFTSSIQSENVYSERDGNTDDLEFLKLENDSKLWNFSKNDKITVDELPITHGIITSTNRNDFRMPRSVTISDTNYPNNTGTYLALNEGDIVTEHTEFYSENTHRYLDGNRIKMVTDNEIDYDSDMADNFDNYLKRLSSNAINIECRMLLSVEQIKSVSSGTKIYLFGKVYKPISISDIEFEKAISICTVKMTQIPTDSEKFDSTLTTFDNEVLTFDKTI